MIRIAAFPKCWIEEITEGRMGLYEWVDRSVELECEGLEMYAKFFESLAPAYLREVRKRVEDLGMCIPMVCYSPDFTHPDQGFRKKEIESQVEMIQATAELGGQYCRTLSGQMRPGVDRSRGIDWVVSCIESCLPKAEQYGVCLVMENHFKDGYWKYKEFAQKMDVFLEIVNRIDSESFGVQYDPSNALVAGDDPIELLEAVFDRVRTMHASDRYLLPGTTVEQMREADGTLGYPKNLLHGVVGRGLNDYDGIFSRLARGGFQGWVSIEDGVNGMEEMKESVSFLRSMREKYFK
jgi:sugar phosphate isomerase/epimerase